jgi:DNA-binding CsgD family transcriptional regulator
LAERARDVPARPFHGYKTYSVYWGIMTAACGQGDYATVRIKQPHIYWIRYDDPASGTICLATEAAALADEGDKVRAVELLSLAFSLPDSVTGWLKRWPLITRLQARLEADLGHSAFLAAWKRGAASDLETEIRRIIGDTKLNTRQQANQALLDPLTDRELEVLDLVAAGLSNRDIAERLVVSVGTVKVHIRHIYNKLDVSSRTQAIAQASGLNLI